MFDKNDSITTVFNQIKKLAVAFLILCLAFELGLSFYSLVHA